MLAWQFVYLCFRLNGEHDETTWPKDRQKGKMWTRPIHLDVRLFLYQFLWWVGPACIENSWSGNIHCNRQESQCSVIGGREKGDQHPNNRCLPIYWRALVKSSVVCHNPSTGILDKLGHVKNKSCYQRGKLITRQYCLFLPLINSKMAGTSSGVSKQSGLQYTIAIETKITEQFDIK